MERLTERFEINGLKAVGVYDSGTDKDDSVFPDVYCEGNKGYGVANKLATYEDLEEQQGFSVKLPCRPDDSVFIIVGKDISRQKIRKVTLEDDSILFETRGRKFGVGCFGDTVFTDRESAERRLKELWED